MTVRWPRLLVSLLLLLCCRSALAAGEPLPLWEAKGAGGTVYLFGSVHVCRQACYPLSDSVIKRLDASSTVALELDPGRPQLVETILKAARLPPGARLNEQLPDRTRQSLATALARLGLPPTALDDFKPWMAASVLTVVTAQRHGLSTEYGIDEWVAARARARNKSLIELETVERQVAAMSAGSTADQIADLSTLLDLIHSARLVPYLDDLVAAWKTGDSARIDALVSEGQSSNKAWRAEMLDTRNIEMVARIKSLVAKAESPLFVVVGVAHFAGNGNIAELLASQGFVVRQIRDGE